MKCILVSYTDVGVNSTDHVVAFAGGLMRLGWSVLVAATPGDPSWPDFAFYTPQPDGTLRLLDPMTKLEPADVVHVWTPRAPIWRFLERHRRLIGGALVMHLEDDEDEVLRGMARGAARPDDLRRRSWLRAHRLEDWSHPVLARSLARAVEGLTILNPELAEHVPPGTPALQILPPLSPVWRFNPDARAPRSADGREHIIVYSGGIHAAVAGEFLALCHAVGALARDGRRVRLVRCGPRVLADLGSQLAQLEGIYEDRGFLPQAQLCALLEEASVLVQPGAPTRFNRRRLPAKLPPYLASGTPVVMPSCYEWLGVRDREHAIFFERGRAEDIAGAIAQVLAAPVPAREMGARAAEFARKQFAVARCCEPLVRFYCELPARTRLPWTNIRRPRVEVPLWLAHEAIASGRDVGLAPAALQQVALEETRVPARMPGRNTVAQLFWPVRGEYLESVSSVCPLHSGRWQRLHFGPSQLAAGKAPRFDPGDRPGIYEIAVIDYHAENGRHLLRYRSPESPRPTLTKLGTTLPLQTAPRRVWRWLSTGNDPQLLFPALSTEATVRITCWLRWTPIE